jgi:CO/xanthine dehydrogenase Mo-binding subunit
MRHLYTNDEGFFIAFGDLKPRRGWENSMHTTVIGLDTPMINAREKVLGRAVYAGDIQFPGMLHIKVVRSPYAHARIVSIDTSAAKALPGVRLVLTGADTPNRLSGVSRKEHRILAVDKVRFIGEEVVAVAAIDEAIARDALDLIHVEYEELPAVFDPELSLSSSVRIHDDRKHADFNNVAKVYEFARGNVDAAFAQAAAVYEATYELHSQYPGYMEPVCTVARMGGDGRLTVWAGTNTAFLARGRYADALGIPVSNVRVVQAMIGGAFGAKTIEEGNSLIAAFVATQTDRPVRFLNSRLEDFQGARSSLPEQIWLKMAVDKEGTIVAKDTKIVADCGAYMGLTDHVLQVSVMRSDNMFRTANVRAQAFLAYTNNPPRGAFRGFGGQQMSFAVNSHVAMLAEKIGMDPMEMQKRNATRTGDTTVHGWVIGSGGLPECLNKAANAIGWKDKLKRDKNAGGARRRGIGVGTAIHVSGNRSMGDWDGATIVLKMNSDGRVTILTGEADMGQGTNTMLAQICAEVLSIPLSHVTVIPPDTDASPFALGSIASRATITAGNAALRAAQQARATLLTLAAEKLDVGEQDLEIASGEIYVKSIGPNRKITFGELARMHIFRKDGEGIQIKATYDSPTVLADHHTMYGNVAPAYTFAAQTVEVEVDTETGQIEILDTYLADDCGRALNPLAVHGQSTGAAVQAIGWTLYENLLFENGQLMNGNFADYTMPTADSVRSVRSGIVETNDPNGPFGAKGASETAIVPGSGAIANAVYDAVGVRINSLPLTPEKVLAALDEKAQRAIG